LFREIDSIAAMADRPALALDEETDEIENVEERE
jgi:hypothetical protein